MQLCILPRTLLLSEFYLIKLGKSARKVAAKVTISRRSSSRSYVDVPLQNTHAAQTSLMWSTTEAAVVCGLNVKKLQYMMCGFWIRYILVLME
jgi:hypothetical protein